MFIPVYKKRKMAQPMLDLPFSLYTVSDLHLEHFNTQDEESVAKAAAACIPKTEVLVLAGDIGWPGTKAWTSFLTICAEKHKLVIYVLGNHELWSKESYGLNNERTNTWTPEEISLCCSQFNTMNIIVLNNQSIEYKGVTFIGSTLWTPLLSRQGVPLAKKQVKPMNDLKRITGFNMTEWRRRFQRSMDYLLTKLECLEKKRQDMGQEVRCIIVTHHAPAFECISDRFQKDILNGCYASEMLQGIFDITFVKAWIFGHTHKTMRKKVGLKRNTLLIGHAAREECYEYQLDKAAAADLGMLCTGPDQVN